MDKQNSFACKTCKASKHACKHVTSLDAWLQTPAGQSTEVLEGYSARSSSCTAHVDKLADDVFEGCGSYLQILEYLFNSAMKGRAYCSGNGLWPACQQCSFSDNVSACRHCVPIVPLDPVSMSPTICPLCKSPWDVRDPVEHGRIAHRSATMSTSVKLDVFYRPCSNAACKHRLQYDGQHDGVFNYSGNTLFTYECMNNFWDHTVVSNLSFYGHWLNMKAGHFRSGMLALLPSRDTIRGALWKYLKLLDIDYSNFGCPCCSQLPHDERCYVMDGVTLGFRKDFASTATLTPTASTMVPDY